MSRSVRLPTWSGTPAARIIRRGHRHSRSPSDAPTRSPVAFPAHPAGVTSSGGLRRSHRCAPSQLVRRAAPGRLGGLRGSRCIESRSFPTYRGLCSSACWLQAAYGTATREKGTVKSRQNRTRPGTHPRGWPRHVSLPLWNGSSPTLFGLCSERRRDAERASSRSGTGRTARSRLVGAPELRKCGAGCVPSRRSLGAGP